MNYQTRFKRAHYYGLTVLELRGPDSDLELKILTRLPAQARRAFVRGFLRQIRPLLTHFKTATIDHASNGKLHDRRNRRRGVSEFNEKTVDSLEGALGFEIRMRRLKLGLGQEQLARKLGIQRSHLSDIERGVSWPRSKTRALLEKALKAEFQFSVRLNPTSAENDLH